jgi:hypothetical protein
MKTLRSAFPAVLLVMGGALHAVPAAATDKAPRQAPTLSAQLQQDLAHCNRPGSTLPVAECRREVYAAYEHARKKGGRAAQPAPHSDNRFRRCEPLQGEYREACIARIEGQGEVRGSVESGGIFRELTIVTPARETAAPAEVPPR